MKARIQNTRKQRYRYIPDLCRPFEAYIGRRLRKWEHAIIYAFENNRLNGERAGRFIIVDNDPKIDSRNLLVTYFLWRAELEDIMFVGPRRVGIIDRVKTGLAERDALTHKNVPFYWGVCPYPNHVLRQHTGTGHYPEGMRGRTWRHCLLLNTEHYNGYQKVISTVVGPLPIIGDSIMVIHTTFPLPCPPAFAPTGPPIEVGVIDETDEPQLIIIELEHIDNQRNECRDARSVRPYDPQKPNKKRRT